MADYNEKIARIEDQMRAQRERIRDLKAQATRQERRDATRRKIIYGAAYLGALDTLEAAKRARTSAVVERHITNPRDREFLGLAPLDEPPGAAAASAREARPAPSSRPGAASPDRPTKRADDSADEGTGTPFLPMFEQSKPTAKS